jgi:hypothetical protein
MEPKHLDSPPESDSLPETDSSTQPLTPHGISAMQGNFGADDASTVGSILSEGDAQTQAAIESLRQVPDIQPDVWGSLNDTERIAALQSVENNMANIQVRPPSDVVATQAGPGEFGYFDPNTKQISVGSHSLEFEPVQENVDTIVHEGRHAYQQYAVENPGFHPKATEVEAWRDNMKPGNYLTAQEYGQELYQTQPIEADAWQYGNNIVQGVYGEKS